MRSDAVAITGVGMASSLGWDAASSCAAARAGLSRSAELANYRLWDEQLQVPLPMVGHSVPQGGEGFKGIGRFARLGAMAIKDLKATSTLPESSLSRTGLFINLSSSYHREQAELRRASSSDVGAEEKLYDVQDARNREEQLRAQLPPLLLKLSGVATPPKYCRVEFQDQPGVFELVQEAAELLRRGVLDQCLVGGIDSSTDPESLRGWNELGLLKGPDNPSGVVPGEAAAFILIEPISRAQARVSNSLVAIGAVTIATEPMHRFSELPSQGRVLADVVARAMEENSDGSRETRVVICGLNGDYIRAVEWGHAMVLLRAARALDGVQEWIPAESFGETGAAAGAIAIVMAERAFARGYARGRKIVIWASSDAGAKAAGAVYQL